MLRLLLLVASCPFVASACVEDGPPAPREVEVRAAWLVGQDAERGDMDRYFDCLLRGSDMATWWGDEVRVAYVGSFVVSAPSEPLRIADVAPFVAARTRAGELPESDPARTSVTIVFGHRPDLHPAGCAELTVAALDGQKGGFVMVPVAPVCWPGTTPLRNATQLAEQELAEVVDWLIGYAPCAGDGGCQADGACELGCDAFVGLTCPGAPTATRTGCGSQELDGWVVQRLSRAQRRAANCLRCTTCDFVPRALP